MNKFAFDDNSRSLSPALISAMLPLIPSLMEKDKIHLGKGKLFDNAEDLKKIVREGDILLSGGKEISMVKALISMFSGHPKGYHVSLMGRDGVEFENHPSGGFGRGVGNNINKNNHVQVLRPVDSRYGDTMVNRANKLSNAIERLRTKTVGNLTARGISESKAITLADSAIEGLYKKDNGLASGLRELFGVGSRSDNSRFDASARNSTKALKDFSRNTSKYVNKFSDSIYDLSKTKGSWLDSIIPSKFGWTGIRKSNDLTRAVDVLPKSLGGVCSSTLCTLVGSPLVDNKPAANAMPTDFLRSPKYKSIGRYDAPPSGTMTGFFDKALTKAPNLVRLGLAGTMAATVYALTPKSNK